MLFLLLLLLYSSLAQSCSPNDRRWKFLPCLRKFLPCLILCGSFYLVWGSFYLVIFLPCLRKFLPCQMCGSFYLVWGSFYLVIFQKCWKICQFVWENWRVLFSLYYRRSPSFKKFRNSKNHSKSYLQQIHTIISS